jgi:beta-glucosidase
MLHHKMSLITRVFRVTFLLALALTIAGCKGAMVKEMPWENFDYPKDTPSTQPDSRAEERAKGGWTLFIRHSDNRKKWVAEQEVDLLMIGDSITFQWSRRAKEIWKKYYGHRKAVNIASSGDRTQHMLWHIQTGGLDGMKNRNPKVVQLLIGTNNRGKPELEGRDTAAGILALLKEIHHRLPDTKIILMALFPRGWEADDPGRLRNHQINEMIKGYADGETVIWVDLAEIFLDEEGKLIRDLMRDSVHPSPKGYVAWAEAMEPILKNLLGK